MPLKDFAEFCDTLPADNGRALGFHDFQAKMLGDYFDGCRETLVLISKKNGKSTLLAAVALHRLIENLDVNVAIVASSRDQAMILFEQARGFVDRSPSLQEAVRVLRGYREIRRKDPADPDNPKLMRGMIKVYAADADTADGWLGDLVLVDELHRHKSLELYSVLRDGLGPRNGQMITISTAGETHDSPLGLLRARAYELDIEREGAYRYVRSGGFCLHEWALEADEDLEDLDLVKTANPAPWMTRELLQERRDSPSMTPGHWARFACGVWGMGATAAFDKELWASLVSPGDRIDEGRKVVLGFDGARYWDGTALIACDIESGLLVLLGYWERPVLADENWEVPEHEVTELVEWAFDFWKVDRLYADPAYWSETVGKWAGDHGKEKVRSWPTQRIKNMATALREFHSDMRGRKVSHDGDEKLAEHIGNAVRHDTKMMDNDEPLWVIYKDSRKSPRKIDAAVAATLAWRARTDAIDDGALNEPDFARAQW